MKDVIIVGGGIVGLSTAREICKRSPLAKILVLEKESSVGLHQSGRNSGVIHAGIYYPPGSVRARLCVSGMQKMYSYCESHNIKHKKIGKLIVATSSAQEAQLQELYRRSITNNVIGPPKLIGRQEILAMEPLCTGGIAAIHSPATGIIDYRTVCQMLQRELETEYNVIVQRNSVVTRIDSSLSQAVHAIGPDGNVVASAKCAIACAGLNADRIAIETAKSYGKTTSDIPLLVPFRGEYLVLRKDRTNISKHLLYPVPDPSLPFLGVHFTPMSNGEVWLGPSAVLATAKEGYDFTKFDYQSIQEMLCFKGIYPLFWKFKRQGINELLRALFPMKQVTELQKFIPSFSAADLELDSDRKQWDVFGRTMFRRETGVRAAAINSDGKIIDDFVWKVFPTNQLHLLNAPSPAATASLAIAEEVVNVAQEHLANFPS